MAAQVAPADGVNGGAASPAGTTTTEPSAGEPTELTPEMLEEYIKQARPLLMSKERAAVAREIQDGLLFDPDKIDLAVADLNKNPADTPQDNIRRTIAAFAAVDERMATVAKKYFDKQYDKAGDEAAALINPAGTGYIDAARRLMQADSLLAQNRYEDAVQAYGEIIANMPEKISFSYTAALKSGQAYEAMHRLLYAMKYYRWWLDNFGFLDSVQAKDIRDKLAAIEADYKDPLSSLAKKMEAVKQRLESSDSGQETQRKEKEIVTMLDDLIAVAEEQGGSSDSNGQQNPSSGQNQNNGGESGQAGGQNQPSSPAKKSFLPGGEAPKPHDLSEIHPSDNTDAWGKLPPQKRQELVEMFKQKYPERYREMVEEYYKRLSEAK